MSEKVNRTPHPIFNAHACDEQVLIRPLLNARPFDVYRASNLIERFVSSAITESSNPITVTDFDDLDSMYIITMIGRWAAATKQYSLVEKRCANMFVLLLFEYINTNPAVKIGIVRSMFGESAHMSGDVTIPIADAHAGIPDIPDTTIKSKRVHIPIQSFDKLMLESFYQSYEFMLKFFKKTIDEPTKVQFISALSGLTKQIKHIADSKGPWHVYETHVNPLHKFAVDLLLDDVLQSGTFSFSIEHVRLKLQAYIPRAKWDKRFQTHLLDLHPDSLLAVYRAALTSGKIPELRAVNNDSILLERTVKLHLNTIGDLQQLRTFPCIEKVFSIKKLSHPIRVVMFSMLLWFYSIEGCHEILKNTLHVDNYDHDTSDKQLRSLLDKDGMPRYFHGTKGFGKFCVGYDNCDRCWLNSLKFPEEYYERKRSVRRKNGY
ncbi:MAG: hypothetical protein Q7J10_08565 [Methanosarcinaceae archaeon]|nr:hypothetical protein [Methanosarcinaceae archaeon]